MPPIPATRADMVLPECFRHLDGVPLVLIDDGNEDRILVFGYWYTECNPTSYHSYLSPDGWDIQGQATDL